MVKELLRYGAKFIPTICCARGPMDVMRLLAVESMFLGLSVLKLAGSFPWPFELGSDRKASEAILSYLYNCAATSCLWDFYITDPSIRFLM